MGPLSGFTIVEIAGIGPGPFCCMLLSDMGAKVIRVDRKQSGHWRPVPGINRGRLSIQVDLKQPAGVETVLRLVEHADALTEGFRPGVMERLGLGPEVCLKRNKRLVYGRITGWGQDGPLAQTAGHDINYIALTGALHGIGLASEPVPPLNLIGDYGGGGMLLAFGLVCALLEARSSGQGQVVDAAMTDGSALLMAAIYGLKANGGWTNQRQTNLLDGGAHFYGVYECADGKWLSIGSIEPQFYALLREQADLPEVEFDAQMDKSAWPDLRARLAAVFKNKTRDQWQVLMEGTDVCFAPVLDLDEAPQHPHNRARETFVEMDGAVQPAPAPRFSRTPASIQSGLTEPGSATDLILAEAGFAVEEIAELRETSVI